MGLPIPMMASGGIAIGLRRAAPEYLIADSVPRTFLSLWVTLLFASILFNMLIYDPFFNPLRNLPRPPGGLPFFGHFLDILRNPPGHVQAKWMEQVPNKGLIQYRQMFNAQRIQMTSPQAVKEVLVEQSYNFIRPKRVASGLSRIVGNGVLITEGDVHKAQRKILNPAFSFRHIKNLYPVFWSATHDMVLAIDKAISQPQNGSPKPSNVVEVPQWASRATLDMIGIAGMGKSFGAISQPGSNALHRAYQTIFKPTTRARVLSILTVFLPVALVRRLPVKRNDEINGGMKVIKDTCRGLIQEKRQAQAQGKESEVDIISVAIESGGFKDEELVDQLLTFMAAGHETTGASMTFAGYLLAKHQNVQKRLREELQSAGFPSVRDANDQVTADLLEKTPYLTAVCNEVLRIIPPVASNVRIATKDTTVCGQFIPKGTNMNVSLIGFNRSKEMWGPDADEFNPDRWLGQTGKSGGASSNFALMTFLQGPKNCIGQNFARAEFACLVAGWVQAYQSELLHPDQELKIANVGGAVTLRPKEAVKVRLQKLDI
ncbi:MAG: hypothetical protein M1828_000733 [Chrysothrix sp. TS-e1954]|nr:MAG: hypothetical protein M1828_000733 [Chrysothrix sp. TS-e1954]